MKKPGLIIKKLFVAVALISAIEYSFAQTQTFTSSGTFTVPNGVTSITVEAWGAGGGGSTITNNSGLRGGGGGGGAYASSIVAVTPGNSYSVVVGTGGPASSPGGSTSFNTDIVVAAGGLGGTNNSTSGGAGGTISSSIGTIRYQGGDGANGGSTYSGGGGGGSGSNGNGGSASGVTAGLGTAINGGDGGEGVSGSSDGLPGNNYGGGGSGACTNSNPNRTGGSGADGLVIITYVGPETFYSYQSGDWNNPYTWTSDPSGTLQTVNSVPGDNSIVIILPDRTVSLPSDVSSANLNITINQGGFLDLSTFRFTNSLSSLSGEGTLKLASTSFPAATINSFVDQGGGTVEYYNPASFTLPVSQTTYNNLTINASGIIATQLNNISLNGNLYVKNGTFRLNDNSSTAKLSLTINGNVTVDNGAGISTGNGVTNPLIGGSGGSAPFLNYYLNFHTVIIKGDFTNNGTVRFTNLNYPVYNAFPPTVTGATSGAASVYFQGAADNTLTCNGITIFYNLILNKGVDQTYKLTINSTDYQNFRIYGANVLPTDGAVTSDPNLRKALWINAGTLVLKGSLIIPSLSEGTVVNADYYIPSSGALLIDGVDVVVLSTADDYREINTAYSVNAPDNATIGVGQGGISSMEFFGKLQVNNGFLSTRESGGLITSSIASGQLIINGGTIDTKQFLSSTGSASYSQSGGYLILRGRLKRTPTAYSTVSNLTDITLSTLNTSRALNGISAGYGTFNLENTSNIFSVSGGTIRIYDVCGIAAGEQEAFDVKSSTSNSNVTGGTLEIIPVTGTILADAANFRINTNIPLYNMVINRLSSSSVVEMSSVLMLQNHLYITSGSLNANNYDLTIGGNLSFENGTTYIPGTNTTILNGGANQVFTFNLASALSLFKFTIAKPAGVSVTLAGSQNTLNITNNFNLTLGTINDAGKMINVAGNTYNSGIHAGTGAFVLNGTNAQTIDGAGVFQNVTLNNTNAATAPVSLLARITINGILTFSNNKLFNIGIYNLLLNSSASITGSGSSRYIQTAGNAGDGGLTKVFSSITPFTFPVGAPTLIPVRTVKYTPATIGFNSAPATFGSITVIPVGYEHPATTVNGQSLTYFWRVKSTGFTGIATNSVTHTFVYNQSDVVGSEGNYIPALYNRTNFTWNIGTNANPPINTTTNTITDWTTPTNSTNFLDADFTAGNASFGVPRIYYSRQSGLWTNLSTWSLTGHTVNNPPSVIPGVNDIVIIGGNDSVYLTTNLTVANASIQSCASLSIEAGSALDIGYNPGCNFAMVVSHPSGNGNFRVTTNYNSPSTFVFPSGDFSDFNENRGTTELYTTNPVAGGTYYLPSTVSSYGNLILSPLGGSNVMFANTDIVVYGNLVTRGENADSWFLPCWGTTYPGSVAAVPKTIYVKGNMEIQGGALIWYQNGSIAQNFVIDGNVTVSRLSALYVWSGATNQSMSIGGSLINNTDGLAHGLSTTSKVDFTNIPVTFFGSSSASISNTSGNPLTIFRSLTVNKGTSQATTLTCNIGGTLTTPANNWLTLQNGTFIYDRTGNFNISQATNFTIPETAGLTINTPSNVYIANSASNGRSLFLSGKLTILDGGGNVYIGPSGNTANNADIEYSGSGSSSLDIRGGNLFVTGQIRRPLATTNGKLNYSQSGGNLIIYGNNSAGNKAKLEILNSSSSFSMSGGTITIVRGGGTTFGDLYLRPESWSVSGGTLIFTQTPASGPAIDADQSYTLDANFPLNDLVVTGKTASTSRTAALRLMVSPLELNGSLSVSNIQSSFNSSNLNVSIKGNLNNNGTYYYGTNKTTFNGGIQAISGSSVTDFYDLDIFALTSLTANRSFTVYHNLNIGSGNLLLTSSLVSLHGNLSNNGAYSDDNSAGGISLAGSVLQQISGTGSFGRLIVNNAAGARLNNDISLQNNLILTTGVLDINKYLLTLNQNSLILGAPYNASRMIKSDGVSSSLGVMKFFNAAAQEFTFPVGVSGKYTPVYYNISTNLTVGSIRVNPVDDCNPSITNPLNALGYYWHIVSSGISGFNANVLMNYLPGDVAGTESNYVAARLVLPDGTWEKAAPGSGTDNVNESTHKITFIHTGTSNIDGDYTAGNDAAIPLEVPTYRTTNNGLWSDQSIWTPEGSSPPCPAGGPVSSNVIIDHVITINTNFVSALSTSINNELRVISPTFGHNLGYVGGNGILYLESGNLPGGVFTDFLSCSGNGTIEYGGSGTYTIIGSQFNSLPNLFVTGTGSRILPVTDFTICKRLVIDGPVLDNSINNRRLTLLGTIERYNTGIFNSGTGTYPSATVVFAGTTIQAAGGPTGDFSGTSKFNNLEINNPAGLNIGTGGLVEVNNQLILNNGIIGASSSNRLVLLSSSPASVFPAGGTAASFINGPLTKNLVNGDSFLYPIGEGTIKSHDFTLTPTSGATLLWTVDYTRPNPTATSVTSPLVVCNTLEYWSVSSTTNATANIKIAWDPLSDLTPLMTSNGISDIRVTEFNSGSWTELESATSGTSYYGNVSTVNGVTVSTTPRNYTTASVTGTLARASFSPGAAVCGNSGIPVTFVSFNPINLNYTLSYTIDNVPQADIIVSSLPYTMPTPVAGTYRLTGFLYNNGTGTGVVDLTPVIVYAVPPTSDAGPDLSLCGVSSTTLAGNDPSPYAGLWTIVSGSGASFGSSVQHNSSFNGTLGTSYTLRWTISNGPCTSSDEVVISFPVVASTPGEFVSAPAQACQGTGGYTYTVPFVSGITYNWSYSGTGHTINGTGNSVTMSFASNATGGTLSVTATNNCGTSSARTTDISVPSANFSYTGTPYCQNLANPLPSLGTGTHTGTFSSEAGLVFASTSTGEIDLDASASGSYVVTNTVFVSGCGTLVATSPVTISGLSWTGSGGTDWNLAGNWSCGYVPYPTTHVLIPDVVNKPALTGGSNGTVNNLTIASGSSVTVSGSTLQIAGSITNNGSFSASDGTIEMNGSSAQIIGASVFSGNTIKNLTVNNNAGVSLSGPLSITGKLLVQNGSMASNGNLTLVSTASGTALIDGSGSGIVTGNVTMQRYLPSAFGYKYISSPFQSATVNELSDELDLAADFPVLYRYNEASTTSGWVDYITPTDPLNPLSGYAANFGPSGVPLTADLTGIVNNGALFATFTNNNNTYTEGFNLAGNPYPSPIDWDATTGWTKTNIDDALYFYSASTTDEYGGTYSTYINGVSTGGLASPVIASMQGFFIHVSGGTYPVTGTLGLDNSVRLATLSPSLVKSEEKAPSGILKMTATFSDNPLSSDPAVVYFDGKAGSGFDPRLDALKLMNTDYYIPNLYSLASDGKKLSINALPEITDTLSVIPLGLKLNIDGDVIFRLACLPEEINGTRIYLLDRLTGIEMEMPEGSEYRVRLDPGEYSGRFFLNLRSKTSIPDPVADELFTVYSSHALLRTKVKTEVTGPGNLAVINLAGQTVFVERIYENGYHEFNPGLQEGVYIVTFTSSKYRESKKIYFRNR